MMNTVQMEASPGLLVAQQVMRASVFEVLGIAYDDADNMPLQDVCQDRGLDPDLVTQALYRLDGTLVDGGHTIDEHPSLCGQTFEGMVEHITYWHHGYLRCQLPYMEDQLARLTRRYGDRFPELWQVEAEFGELHETIARHMEKEELVVFPICRRLTSSAAPPAAYAGAIECAIHVLEREHQKINRALHGIRELTHDYACPDEGGADYRLAMRDLAKLEADLPVHQQEEDEVLFARVIRASQALEDQDLDDDI